jgi:hypothetical protein
MSEDEETPSNWTIKNVPPAVRKEALKWAGKRGETAAEWLARAVATQAGIDAGDRIEMPSEKPAPEPAASPGPSPEQLHALAELAREAREGARAAEVNFPKSAARQTLALLDAAQRAALGKPPKLPRQRKLALPAIEGHVASES